MKYFFLLISLIFIMFSPSCSAESLFECEHEISQSITSPDGELVAALDNVGCGATTEFVTWVLIAPTGIRFDPKKHRLAVYEGKLTSITWLSPKVLRVEGKADLFSIDDSFGISIE